MVRSFSTGICYPARMGFPLSTYMESVFLAAQSLGIACYVRGLLVVELWDTAYMWNFVWDYRSTILVKHNGLYALRWMSKDESTLSPGTVARGLTHP